MCDNGIRQTSLGVFWGAITGKALSPVIAHLTLDGEHGAGSPREI